MNKSSRCFQGKASRAFGKKRLALLILSSAAMGMSAVALAQEKEEDAQPRQLQARTPVTSAYELDRLGLPLESTNVYQTRPGHYVVESNAESADPAPLFGDKNTDKYSVGWPAFDADRDDLGRRTMNDSAQYFYDTNDSYYAPVHLPTGVSILGVETFYLDNNNAEELRTYFHQVCQTTSDPGTVTETIQQTAATGPANVSTTPQQMPFAFPTPPTIDNRDCHYAVRVDFDNVDNNNGPFLYKMNVIWQRMISAPPAIPTFGDVQPTHSFFAAIEAMVASGVTGGCGGGNYCPNDNVTRGQMASFLARFGGL